MGRVSAAIRVEEPASAARTVGIRPVYGSAYRERQLARSGLENPWHADQWNTNAPYLKTAE